MRVKMFYDLNAISYQSTKKFNTRNLVLQLARDVIYEL